jgi:hypothetical protein
MTEKCFKTQREITFGFEPLVEELTYDYSFETHHSTVVLKTIA